MEKFIKEKRATKSTQSIRAINENVSGNTKRFIEGYGSLFNHPSKLLYEWHEGEYRTFYEVILPGAFDDVLADPELNCIHTVDHNEGKLIGRTKSGTLNLSVDEVGLKYLVDVPNTTHGNDLYELVGRGDYYESSFIFTVKEERWEEKPEGLYRYIEKVLGLYDTSTVLNGAYADTAVVARGKVPTEYLKQDEPNKEKIDIDFEFFLREHGINS
jgi:uncharacterized protein